MMLGSEYYNLCNTNQQINPLNRKHECKDPVFFSLLLARFVTEASLDWKCGKQSDFVVRMLNEANIIVAFNQKLINVHILLCIYIHTVATYETSMCFANSGVLQNWAVTLYINACCFCALLQYFICVFLNTSW